MNSSLRASLALIALSFSASALAEEHSCVAVDDGQKVTVVVTSEGGTTTARITPEGEETQEGPAKLKKATAEEFMDEMGWLAAPILAAAELEEAPTRVVRSDIGYSLSLIVFQDDAEKRLGAVLTVPNGGYSIKPIRCQ